MAKIPPDRLRVGFAGTPDFAARILRALIDLGWPPILVLTQPDRPAGRGKKLSASAVKSTAAAHGIETLEPTSLRTAASSAALVDADLDVLIVAAYGLILPGRVLDIPRLGCINVHASLLPRWRGAAPIERAMMAGDPETGVSIMRMDEGLDTGPVYIAEALAIDSEDTGDRLHERLAELGTKLLIEVLESLPGMAPIPQDDAGACYAPKLTSADAALSWDDTAINLARRIQALNSRMPAFTMLGGERLRLLSAYPDEGPHDRAPGSIVAADRTGLKVATGSGHLIITELQLSRGKARPMSVADALNGHAELLAPGRVFDA